MWNNKFWFHHISCTIKYATCVRKPHTKTKNTLKAQSSFLGNDIAIMKSDTKKNTTNQKDFW